jgi:hypothetical protein
LIASVHTDASDHSALNLTGVTIVPPVGPSIHLAAVRVPLAAVSAWWACQTIVKSVGGSGVGVGVGVAIPF